MKTVNYKLQPLDLWMADFLNGDNTGIFIFMRLAKLPDIARLKKALTVMAQVVPEILCYFNRKKKCFVEAGLSPDDLVTVADDYYKEGLIPHINLSTGPLFRVTISPCAEGGYWFNVGATHLLTDGGGLKECLRMLCYFYNYPEKAEAKNFKNLRDPASLFRKFKPAKLSIPPEIMKVHKSFGKVNIQVEVRNANSHYQINKIDLLPHELTRLKAKAKEADATLNDVFLTLFHFGLHRHLVKERIVLGCPVDLRTFFAENIGADTFTVCNLTSYYHIPIKIEENSTFDSVLHSVKTVINRQKETNSSLVKLKTFYKIPAWIRPWIMKAQNTTEPIVLYSNVGIIDDNIMRFNDNEIIDCFIGGSFKELPGIRLLISTFRGKCTLLSNSLGSLEHHLLVTTMLEDMKQMALEWSTEPVVKKPDIKYHINDDYTPYANTEIYMANQ